MRLSPRQRAGRLLRFEQFEPRLFLSAQSLSQLPAEHQLTGQGQTVAVIDSGIAYRHAALGGGFGAGYRVEGGFDFTPDHRADAYDAGPAGGHGTHVAGILASTDPAHLGVAPGVDLVALRVFDQHGDGSLSLINQALQWVHAHRNDFRWPITTVNISLGAAWNGNAPPAWATLETSLAQLEADGMFIAVAAGNGFAGGSQSGLNYPAVSPHVVPVAAANADGTMWSGSQRNSRVLVAPGSGIVSTAPDYRGDRNGRDDDFARYSGTSMATPVVAGASVLLREAYQLAGVQYVSQQTLYDLMVTTADTIHDPQTGQDYHRLNLDRAIAAVLPGHRQSESNPSDLGTVTDTRQVTGQIERPSEVDWFRFTAAQSGTVTLTVATTGNLLAQWKPGTGLPGAASAAANVLTFQAAAGQTYAFGLAARQGAGGYTLTISRTTSDLLRSSGVAGDNRSAAPAGRTAAAKSGLASVRNVAVRLYLQTRLGRGK